MGWSQKPSVNGPERSSRPARRARGASTGRCRPISRGVDTVGRERLSSLTVSVPAARFDGAPALMMESPSRSVNADVVAQRIGLERALSRLTADISSPEAARAKMENGWRARAATGDAAVDRRNTVFHSETHKLREARSRRSSSQALVGTQRNPVLAVAENFLHRLEDEVASAASRAGRDGAHLRVLKHPEQLRLLGIVQRCSRHSVQYASPDPSPADVRQVSDCLNTSPIIARSILDQARRARTLLIRFNVRLCGSLARKYVRSGGVDLDTLMAEACAGLSEAIDRFDRSRDMRFTTYATHWILRNVRRCVMLESRPGHVQLPVHIHYKLVKLLSIKTEVLACASAADQTFYESNPEALAEAIAQEAGLPVDDVKTTLASGLPMLDLDKPVFDDSSVGDNIDYLVQSNEGLSAGGSPDDLLEEEAREQLAVGTLSSMLATLHPREANVLRLRFGLNLEHKRLPRAEIAAAYGLSGERIRQIEQGALLKLSKPWRKEFVERAIEDSL